MNQKNIPVVTFNESLEALQVHLMKVFHLDLCGSTKPTLNFSSHNVLHAFLNNLS